MKATSKQQRSHQSKIKHPRRRSALLSSYRPDLVLVWPSLALFILLVHRAPCPDTMACASLCIELLVLASVGVLVVHHQTFADMNEAHFRIVGF